jgi:hypothetical protein
MCGDVENGALTSWAGYACGYTSISRVNELVAQSGRPRRLWTAHYDPLLGAHICARSIPACVTAAGGSLVTDADGTQWVDHGGWDESLLHPNFFDIWEQHPTEVLATMDMCNDAAGNLTISGPAKDNGDLLVFTRIGGKWSVTDVTAAIHGENPADPRNYQVV